VLLFERFCLPRFGFEVGVDLCPVSVVIGEGRVNLRSREVSEFSRNLFWNQTHAVPLGDSANGDACSGNTRPTGANIWTSRDETAYLGDGFHRFKCIAGSWVLPEIGVGFDPGWGGHA